jgi:hypothetical protein
VRMAPYLRRWPTPETSGPAKKPEEPLVLFHILM